MKRFFTVAVIVVLMTIAACKPGGNGAPSGTLWVPERTE